MKQLTANYILRFLANEYDVNYFELSNKSRKSNLVRVRFLYFYLSRVLTIQSLADIGAEVKRDHATAIYGFQKIQNEIDIYPDLKAEINALKLKLNPPNKMIIEDINLLQLTQNYTSSFI